MLSKITKYSIRAILFLSVSTSEEKLLGVRQLSDSIKISEPMLSKVLQSLTKMNLIISKKGRNGGFYMSEEQKNLSLMHLIKTIEQSDYIVNECLLGQKGCAVCENCPYQSHVLALRKSLNTIYNTNSILETAKKLDLTNT